MSTDPAPLTAGALVRVRRRTFLVEQAVTAPDASAVVSLACVDDDAQRHRLDVIWDVRSRWLQRRSALCQCRTTSRRNDCIAWMLVGTAWYAKYPRTTDPSHAPCTSGSLELPVRSADESYRYLGFMASIAVPYYMIYDLARMKSGDDYWKISFDFTDADVIFVREIGCELESTFPEVAPMPKDVGRTIVPGVRTSARPPGQATIYDCLFSDDW